jgi:hypothetical protein
MRRVLVGCVVLVTLGLLGMRSGAQTPAAPAQAARPAVFVAIYERGAAWDAAKSAFQQANVAEHRQFLQGLGERRLGAAPFMEALPQGSRDSVVGLVILTAASKEEAEAALAPDAAITSGVMKLTVRRWMADSLKGF